LADAWEQEVPEDFPAFLINLLGVVEIRYELDVAFGSKGEILAASRCFPLFSQHRTFGGAISVTVNLHDLSDLQLDR
jgi:hypothetical protein